MHPPPTGFPLPPTLDAQPHQEHAVGIQMDPQLDSIDNLLPGPLGDPEVGDQGHDRNCKEPEEEAVGLYRHHPCLPPYPMAPNPLLCAHTHTHTHAPSGSQIGGKPVRPSEPEVKRIMPPPTPTLLGNFSIAWHVKHLKGHSLWGLSLLVSAGMWGDRGYSDGSTPCA